MAELSEEALRARKNVKEDRVIVLLYSAMAEKRLKQGDKVSQAKKNKKEGDGGGATAKTVAKHNRKDVEEAIARACEWLRKAPPTKQEQEEAAEKLELIKSKRKGKLPLTPLVPVPEVVASPASLAQNAGPQSPAQVREHLSFLIC